MSKQFDLYDREDSQTQHEELVARLCKKGEAILAELSPTDAHCMHMAMGIAGEAGEVVDLVKKAVVYGKQVELEKYIEEMGDLEFYLQGLRSSLGIDRPTVLDANIVKLTKRYGADKYTDEAAIARADKMEPALKSPRILILGHARHGKDTVAEMLCDILAKDHGVHLTFASSSEFACEKVVFPAFREKVEVGDWFVPDYDTVAECYEDRANHRALWYEAIKGYNADDGARLAKELLRESNIYVGMRSVEEFRACIKQKLFDATIWVDAGDRVPKEDGSSISITYDDFLECSSFAKIVTVYNSGGLKHLYKACQGTATWLVSAFSLRPEPATPAPASRKLTISGLTSAQLQAYRYTMQAINLFANYGPDLPIQAIRREFEDSFFYNPENFVIR